MQGKIRLIIFSFLGCFFLLLTNMTWSQRPNEKVKITSRGFKNYKINSTTIDKVIRDFGKDFQKIDDEVWDYKLTYKKLGLSFSYGVGGTIKAIEFYSPFKGITDKGIELDVSTMADVESVYGSLDWSISSPFIEWSTLFSDIEFLVARDTTLPIYPLNEKIHRLKRVCRIIVADNSEDMKN